MPASPQSLLSRRHLSAGVEGAQAGHAPSASRPACDPDRPCRPPGGDRDHGPVAGRCDQPHGDGRRRRQFRARPIRKTSVSSPRPPFPSTTQPTIIRSSPQSGFRPIRRRPPNPSATPPPTARKWSRRRRPDATMFLVVGAPNSSNSKRLVEVAKKAGAPRSLLVQRADELPWGEIDAIATRTIGLSAGASAPEIIVDEIIDAFPARFDVTVELAETVKEDENFLVMRDLRDVELTAADMAFVNGGAQACGCIQTKTTGLRCRAVRCEEGLGCGSLHRHNGSRASLIPRPVRTSEICGPTRALPKVWRTPTSCSTPGSGSLHSDAVRKTRGPGRSAVFSGPNGASGRQGIVLPCAGAPRRR